MINTNQIILFILVTLLLTSCAGQAVKQAETYKIASIVPLTGSGATIGISTANGMHIAVDEINAGGGINGNPIELYIQDSKLSGKEAVNAAQFLLKTQDPDIFTVLFATPAISVSPILQEAQKPMIYEAYSRQALDNPFAFKANFDSETGCERLARYLKENNRYKQLGVLFAKTFYNDECFKGVAKVEPDIKEFWYSYGDTDFRTIFEKANANNVDTLITTALEFEFVAMFKQLSELGYNISIACATASECITPKVTQLASEETLNKVVSIDFIDPLITQSEFAGKYEERFSKVSSTEIAYGAVGYEEVMIISEAMKRCSPGDSICLTESLSTVKNYSSVIGSDGFEDRVLGVTTEIYEYQDGDWIVI